MTLELVRSAPFDGLTMVALRMYSGIEVPTTSLDRLKDTLVYLQIGCILHQLKIINHNICL